jgi:hypothetical protein
MNDMYTPLNLREIELNTNAINNNSTIYLLKHSMFNGKKINPSLINLETPRSFNFSRDEIFMYQSLVDNILHDIYSKDVVTFTRSKKKGLFFPDCEIRWSEFNKINTNIMVMTFLYNYVNAYLLDEKEEKMEINIHNIIDYVKKYGRFLFTDKIFMTGVIMMIKKNSNTDSLATTKIKKMLLKKNYTDIVIYEKGSTKDMFLGRDITYKDEKGNIIGIQVKSYNSVNINGNNIHVHTMGGTKLYKPKYVDYYYFYRFEGLFISDNILIFKNDDSVQIDMGYENGVRVARGYIFPVENKIIN